MHLTLLGTLALAGATQAAAGDEIEEIEAADVEVMGEEHTWFDQAYPEFERVLNVLTARTARPNTFVVAVVHRTAKRVDEDPQYNYFGFDSGGLKIGLAVRYGVMDGLDIGIARLNGTVERFDTYEIDARYRLLKQATSGVDLALRAGGSWFVEKDNQALAYFGQLLADRVIANRLLVTAGLLYHSDSSNARKRDIDTEYSAAFNLGLDLRLSGMLAFDVEVTTTLAGYKAKAMSGRDTDGPSTPAFSLGPKVVTNRHTFALVFSNTQYVFADGIVTNSYRKLNNMIIGFNITRELGL